MLTSRKSSVEVTRAMNVHVVVPDLLWSPEAEHGAAPGERRDALERLLARGRRSMHPGVGLEAWLLGRFGVGKQQDWPAAPYSLAADGGAPESDWWLRADPVHIRVGRDSPSLADTAAFDLARDEAQALVASLNAYFAPDNLVFHPTRPDRWYVRCVRPSAIATTPTADARGRPLETLLPQGADAPRWHAVLNEVQMLLHEHPVNDAREARGALPVNSVWLWGGGTLVKPARTPYACVLSGDPVARGLALAAGARHEPVPGSTADRVRPRARSSRG